MEETENGPVKTRRFSQRQYQLVALVVFVLLGFGLVMWSLGLFKSHPKEQAQVNPDENQTKALAVPKAKNKAMDTDKYRNVDKDDARFRSEGNGDVNVGAVLGQDRTDRQTTNELLDDNDALRTLLIETEKALPAPKIKKPKPERSRARKPKS